MSIVLDSTDYITRTANLPSRTAFTIGGWVLAPASWPASRQVVFALATGGYSNEIAMLRYNVETSKFRVGNDNGFADFASNPSANQWLYFFVRGDASNINAGWKTIADSSFTGSGNVAGLGSGTPAILRVGATPFYDALGMSVFRLSVWDDYVSDPNLLLAAATDLGYTTNLNTHIPGTATGDPDRYADTSGNGRNWTPNGTISDGSNPSFGGNNDLAGSATAGATGSATLAVQRNLAAAAVAGALASGTLSINRALTGAAIGAALGSATLTAFSSVWRVPTNAPNGTAVHCTVFSGASPTYAILAQGTAVVAGGFIDIPGTGTIGAKAFAFVHNYSDNTATTNIRGGPAIATLTSL